MRPEIVRAHLAEALDLLTPVWCASCGLPGVAACDDCAATLFGPLRRVDQEAPVLTEGPRAWAPAVYCGPARDLILAWKRGRGDLGPLFREAGRQLADRWLAAPGNGLTAEAVLAGRLTVSPAPSGLLRRARGRLVALDLADAVASALRESLGERVEVIDALRRSGTGHLAGKSARGRSRARQDFRVVRRVPAGPCLLVDDVVTSGATLRAAARAIARQSGVQVVGALAVAATPPRSATQAAGPGAGRGEATTLDATFTQ